MAHSKLNKLLIDNLIDDKYYDKISNIITSNEDFVELCIHLYDNSNFNDYASVIILKPVSLNLSNVFMSHRNAYYIPMDIEVLTCKNPFYYDFNQTIKEHNYIIFDTSLEEVLKQSREIPPCDVNSARIHNIGNPVIMIDKPYKRIDTLIFNYLDIDDQYHPYVYEEILVPLYYQNYVKYLRTLMTPYKILDELISGNNLISYMDKNKIETSKML